MKRDQSSKRVTRSMPKKIKNESEVDDPRKALFAAIQSRKKEESPKKPHTDPRQALFAAIKNQTKGESPGKDCDSSASEVTHTPGVHRLQKFLSHSKSVLSMAERDQDAAIRACKVRFKHDFSHFKLPHCTHPLVLLQGLAVYCGEDGGERSATPLLQVLADFALSLENGVKKYDKRIKAEKKKAAKKKNEAGKENKQNIAPASNKLL